MGVGRRQNAEPRWLLPLICRRGHITRNEIGAIRIGQHESWFQVPRAIAPKFAETLERTFSSDDEQDAIVIAESSEGPRVEARSNRKAGGARVQAKPFHKGKGDKPRFEPKQGKKKGSRFPEEKARPGKSKPVKSKPENKGKQKPWGKKGQKNPKRR